MYMHMYIYILDDYKHLDHSIAELSFTRLKSRKQCNFCGKKDSRAYRVTLISLPYIRTFIRDITVPIP
jgi:hypothetical protein